MTREELIEQEAHRLGQMYFPDESNIWARPNYEAQWVTNACMEIANLADKTMIDKACLWLRETAHFYVSDFTGELDDNGLIEDFKKAMEE